MTSLPAGVADFITSHLTSLADLQVLLTCIDAAERWWSPAVIARELNVTTGAARKSLDHLARRTLLDIRISDDVRYRFSPVTPQLTADALACAAAFRKNPLSVLELFGRSRSVRDFADAFRIKRHDDR